MRRFLRRRAAARREEHRAAEIEDERPSPSTEPPRGTTEISSRRQSAAAGSPVTAGAGARPQARELRSPHQLLGANVPSLLFNNFDRRFLDLGELAASGLVLYVYPGCERSPTEGGKSLDADASQHRAYSLLRDSFAEVVQHGAIAALSSIPPTQQFHQSPELAWEQDADAPFQHYLISDEMLQLAHELGLPTFQHEGMTFYERLTLIARGGRIQRVFHPVQAGQDARQALAWLQLH